MWKDFNFVGFTSTRTHFESTSGIPIQTKLLSATCAFFIFPWPFIPCISAYLREPQNGSTSLSLSWPCPLFNCPFWGAPSIYFQSSHMKGPQEAPCSFTIFSHCGTTPQVQLVPLWVWDKIPSQNFLGNTKATFLTLSQRVQQNWKTTLTRKKKINPSTHTSPWTQSHQNFQLKKKSFRIDNQNYFNMICN